MNGVKENIFAKNHWREKFDNLIAILFVLQISNKLCFYSIQTWNYISTLNDWNISKTSVFAVLLFDDLQMFLV